MDQYQSKVTFTDLPKEVNPAEINAVLNQMVLDRTMSFGNLTYNCVPREMIIEINTKYLEHHYPTDIITFDYVENKVVHGEIYICDEEVRDNANDFKVPYKNEMMRVIIHGLLHLLGFNDSTEEEKTLMRKIEEKYLLVWKEGAYGQV